VTTATHSLDASAGATTVAELLARNSTPSPRSPHRRTRSALGQGQFDGTLPAFPPLDEAPTQYRYDETTVAALLADQPAKAARADGGRSGLRAGRKIAGIAFAGAVLVGGWALASAQPAEQQGPTASGPVPGQVPPPPSGSTLALSSPVGTQVTALAATSPAATTTTPQAKAPDQGRFSGTLPTTKATKPKAAPKAQARPPVTAAAPKLPSIPAGGYGWPSGWDQHGNTKFGGGDGHNGKNRWPHH
jgi:hypothetical protein